MDAESQTKSDPAEQPRRSVSRREFLRLATLLGLSTLAAACGRREQATPLPPTASPLPTEPPATPSPVPTPELTPTPKFVEVELMKDLEPVADAITIATQHGKYPPKPTDPRWSETRNLFYSDGDKVSALMSAIWQYIERHPDSEFSRLIANKTVSIMRSVDVSGTSPHMVITLQEAEEGGYYKYNPDEIAEIQNTILEIIAGKYGDDSGAATTEVGLAHWMEQNGSNKFAHSIMINLDEVRPSYDGIKIFSLGEFISGMTEDERMLFNIMKGASSRDDFIKFINSHPNIFGSLSVDHAVGEMSGRRFPGPIQDGVFPYLRDKIIDTAILTDTTFGDTEEKIRQVKQGTITQYKSSVEIENDRFFDVFPQQNILYLAGDLERVIVKGTDPGEQYLVLTLENGFRLLVPCVATDKRGVSMTGHTGTLDPSDPQKMFAKLLVMSDDKYQTTLKFRGQVGVPMGEGGNTFVEGYVSTHEDPIEYIRNTVLQNVNETPIGEIIFQAVIKNPKLRTLLIGAMEPASVKSNPQSVAMKVAIRKLGIPFTDDALIQFDDRYGIVTDNTSFPLEQESSHNNQVKQAAIALIEKEFADIPGITITVPPGSNNYTDGVTLILTSA